MPKFITRIVVVILVSCLAGEPVFSSFPAIVGGESIQIKQMDPRPEAAGDDTKPFALQALALGAESSPILGEAAAVQVTNKVSPTVLPLAGPAERVLPGSPAMMCRMIREQFANRTFNLADLQGRTIGGRTDILNKEDQLTPTFSTRMRYLVILRKLGLVTRSGQGEKAIYHLVLDAGDPGLRWSQIDAILETFGPKPTGAITDRVQNDIESLRSPHYDRESVSTFLERMKQSWPKNQEIQGAIADSVSEFASMSDAEVDFIANKWIGTAHLFNFLGPTNAFVISFIAANEFRMFREQLKRARNFYRTAPRIPGTDILIVNEALDGGRMDEEVRYLGLVVSQIQEECPICFQALARTTGAIQVCGVDAEQRLGTASRAMAGVTRLYDPLTKDPDDLAWTLIEENAHFEFDKSHPNMNVVEVDHSAELEAYIELNEAYAGLAVLRYLYAAMSRSHGDTGRSAKLMAEWSSETTDLSEHAVALDGYLRRGVYKDEGRRLVREFERRRINAVLSLSAIDAASQAAFEEGAGRRRQNRDPNKIYLMLQLLGVAPSSPSKEPEQQSDPPSAPASSDDENLRSMGLFPALLMWVQAPIFSPAFWNLIADPVSALIGIGAAAYLTFTKWGDRHPRIRRWVHALATATYIAAALQHFDLVSHHPPLLQAAAALVASGMVHELGHLIAARSVGVKGKIHFLQTRFPRGSIVNLSLGRFLFVMSAGMTAQAVFAWWLLKTDSFASAQKIGQLVLILTLSNLLPVLQGKAPSDGLWIYLRLLSRGS